jgi:hypothetical protein
MSMVNDPNATSANVVPKPKPVIKKVKVVNTGNEIRKMTARKRIEEGPAAPKSAPQDAPKPTPQSPWRKRKADHAASSTLAVKSPVKRKPRPPRR